MSKHLVIIDGMGFVFRAFHAVRGNLSRSTDGMPTNALFGMAQMLVKVVEDLKPDMCVVALDAKGGNWRHKLYPTYKANRKEPDEALALQLPHVRPLVEAFGLPVICETGFEADDIIATLVKHKQRYGAEKVTIVTSDKDLLQLVGDGVVLLDTLRDKTSGPDEAVEKFGVGPDLIADVQGLMGDSIDNIPGVPGVGPKTAGDLVSQLGNLEAIYADLSKVARDTLRAKLEENRDNAFLSRDLARLDYDVAWPEIDLTFHPRLHEAADYLRDELEFKTLANRLEKRQGKATGMPDDRKTVWRPVEKKAEPVEGAAAWGDYECVTTRERWDWWMAEVRRVGKMALDTETTGLDPYTAELVGLCLSVGAGKACYVPVKMKPQPTADTLDMFAAQDAHGPHGVEGLDVLDDVRALLADPAVTKIGHNLKFDWLVLARALGVTPQETGEALQKLIVNYDDTMLMSACVDGGRWGHGMDDLVARHLGHTMIAFKDVAGSGKAMVTFDKVPLEQAVAYAAEDADATWRLWEVFAARLDAENADATRGVKVVYEQVERPLLPVLVAMEARGVCVDKPELERLSADFDSRMKVFEGKIWELAGHEFNVQSTQQLAVVLFDELNAGSDKLKKKRSTAVDVLEEIAAEGTTKGALVAQIVSEYRQLAKLKSTYADALVKQISPVTQRVHTSYQQVGAATGRFSSSDPNLQNIPIRTEEGRKIRHAFVPREGWVMVSADYSQIELRLLAHFSGSEPLRQAFREGFDIHAYTASLVRGIPMEQVTKEQRRAAKFINFGLVYGMGARSLAGQIGCSLSEAQEWIEAYFRRYDGVRDYMELNKQLARERGYVETLCGRRVWLPEIQSVNGGLRAGAERAAINAPLQGSNADVIKLAMPKVEMALKNKPAQLLMQVHDELVLECAPEAVDEIKVMLPHVMGSVVELAVPLAVEAGEGPNWEAAH
ncbi:MAG: DNA polymerase I [Blastochloris viridis]|uniref:DNA polymerase I n=1 Tax=Blastochloris viridis TaxID=1079 RepID=A0A6N4R0G9_BLAVI|nr:MAG: DNA polymerase I [Blastochloris viridis]